MSDWTSGYVADIAYTYGYYIELNPLRVKLAFLNAGLVCPKFGAACELGYGQGLSTNIHASASLTEWSGTDFNPAQAGFAQELATVAESNTKLFDQAFAEFAARSDLPQFDYIGLHGIWSWVSDENRSLIVDFIRQKLKVGGVLYISYNTQPAWAAMVPVRDLLTEHSEVMGASGQGIVQRIDAALLFAEKLLATNPTFANVNPVVAKRIKHIKEQNRNYVAHEYFNRDWKPMSFADIGRWLEPAKLTYAASANYMDYVDQINLTPDQQAFLAEIPDEMFRQTVRDFMVNQQFRKDYWVRGARTISSFEQAEGLRAQRVMLATHRPNVSLKVTGALGEANLNEEIYKPILDALADHQAKTLGQLEQLFKDQRITFAHIIQAILLLAASGTVAAVQDDAVINKAKIHTDKLNAHLLSKARGSGDINYLASPVTGGGVMVARFPQLFLLAIGLGKKRPDEWAQFVWQILEAQGQKIIVEGTELETVEANLAELRVLAETFALKQLPVLIALQIA